MTLADKKLISEVTRRNCNKMPFDVSARSWICQTENLDFRKNFLLYATEVLLANDNVSMSVGHLDHVLLTVYSSMEHVTSSYFNCVELKQVWPDAVHDIIDSYKLPVIT